MIQGASSPPVAPPSPPAGAEFFTYSGGRIQKVGDYWVETQTSGALFSFEQLYRDNQVLALYDPTRGLALRLPVAGGMAMWSTFTRDDWVPLYNISPGN
jgi:hypothetical protein